MEPKTGYRTTEFWITAVVNIASAVLMILAGYGLVTDEEANLWLQLARALVSTVAPIVIAITTAKYTESRTRVKEAAAKNGG